MKTIISIYVCLMFLPSVIAEELNIETLRASDIKGKLGVSLHTICKLECKVVDMSFTQMKADHGRLGFQILVINDKKPVKKVYIDIPLYMVREGVKKGNVKKFWGYETITSSGYPSEAFRKLNIDSFACVGLHLRSKLVVLKEIK